MIISWLVLLLVGFAVAAGVEDAGSSWDNEEWDMQQPMLGENNSTEQRCALACQSLLKSNLVETNLMNTTSYDNQKASYWSSFQSDVSPACFVEPSTPQEIAAIISQARRTKCHFAVKGGGHAAFTGASNAPGGITILMWKFNQLELSEDKKITRVGTGNTWIDVYDYLTPKGLSVVGGRVTAIGTGGLTLGGGISFFSGRWGWACDGVKEYQLVTASGEILKVNKESYPDLYWALRGGGNQFGVVTRLDLETFPQGSMWGGNHVLSWEARESNLEAFYHFVQRAPEDVDASMWLAFAYNQEYKMFFTAPYLTQAKGVENASIFRNFTRQEASYSSLRMSNMSDLAREVNGSNKDGVRESYWTNTILLDLGTMREVVEIWAEEVLGSGLGDVEGVMPAFVFQPIPLNIMQHFPRNGGNALGLDAEQGPLLIMSVPTWWSHAKDDELVLKTLKRITERCVERSKELGTWHSFIYMNYAAKGQGVFEGYGEGNLERLRGVARKWDPEGVWSELQPGYFGLWD